jgi:hypothetical protein
VEITGQAHLDVAGYLGQRCRPLVDSWCAAGPVSPLLDGDSEAALSYYVGAMLWVTAAHRDNLVGEALNGAKGTNPRHFLQAYEAAVAEHLRQGPLTWQSGALDLTASRLSVWPAEGAERREGIILGAGDLLVLPLYLPAASGNLELGAGLPEGAALRLGSEPLEPGAGTYRLDTATRGWHELRVEMPEGCESVALEQVTVRPAPE